MELDAEKLVKAFAEKLDLSNFKGDIVAFKHVENEINSVEKGGIGVYYANGKKKPFDDAETQEDEPPAEEWEKLSVDEKVKRSILKMQEEKKIKKKDYTLLLQIMNEVNKHKGEEDYIYKSLDLPHFDNASRFVEYLSNTLNLNEVPSRSTIDDSKAKINIGKFPWTYTDADTIETNRRNNIVKRFLAFYRKGK